MFRYKQGTIKRWLQTDYVSKDLLNALDGRWERFSILRGAILLIIGVGMLGYGFSFDSRDSAVNEIILFMAMFFAGTGIAYAGYHNLRLRYIHQRRVDLLIEGRWWMIHLISDEDVIFRMLMFPALEAHLKGTTLKTLDLQARAALVEYDRKARRREMQYDDLVDETDSPLLQLKLRHDYEFGILQLAKQYATELAEILLIDVKDVSAWFKYRESVWTTIAREEMAAALAQQKEDVATAKQHLGTLM